MNDRVENRRLTTIVAADIAEFSRLISEAEEDTLNRIARMRSNIIDPEITAHQGRIANTAGDSLLLEFPSVVNALRCMIRIQARIEKGNAGLASTRRILFRVGVNVGDVIERGGDLFGDGVNVAARLEQYAKPGSIALTANAYEQARARLEATFTDHGLVSMKNMPEPVHVYAIEPGAIAGGKAPGPEAAGKGRPTPARRPSARNLRRAALAAGFIALIAVIGAGGYWGLFLRSHQASPPPASGESAKRSIAVLPFTNMSGDAKQDYFSDGMTEDLITDLSRVPGLFVIARNTVFTYKGKAVNVARIAEELKVNYVLEGSVRKADNRVRISAQLINAATGAHVWADRFDRKLGDIFALQDDVTNKIITALAVKFDQKAGAGANNSGQEASPEGYDLYLRGVEALRQFTPASIARARTYFLKAIARDPKFARAYATMAFTYTASGIFFLESGFENNILQALHYGRRALEIDQSLPQGHFALSVSYLRQGRFREALKSAENAVKYAPNYADGFAVLAAVQAYLGQGREAEASIHRAMALNPYYSSAYIDILGRALFVMKHYRAAAEQFRHCIVRNHTMLSCHAFLVAAHGLTGELGEAQWGAEELLNLKPDFSIAHNNISRQFKDEDIRTAFNDGLRKASIPEN